MRAPDHRGWWTGAIAVVAAFWIYVLAVLPAHYDVPTNAVLARIDFMNAHGWVTLAETIAVVSMLVTSVATVVHVAFTLSARVRVIPLASAGLMTIAAVVMVASTAIYMAGMAEFAPAHLRWVVPAELIAASVLVISGAASCWIAREDRERMLLRRIPLARGRIRTVDPRGGHHDRQGARERSRAD